MPELLTENKKQWAGQFKPTLLRGMRLNYNAAVSARYRARLTSLVKQMTSQTRRDLEKLYKSEAAKAHFGRDSYAEDENISSAARILTNRIQSKFQQLFSRKAVELAMSMVSDSDKASASAVTGSLKKLSGGLTLKTGFVTGPMETIMRAHVAENVALIKSIPQKFFTDVQGAVMRSITSGNGLADLVPAIEKYEGMSVRRAQFIAEDQTRKVYSNLNFERMAKVGVKKFEWIHSGGGAHPRELHEDMDGQVFSMSDLPVIDDKTGERGIPGQLPNCRCTMCPVIDFEESED